MIIFKTLNTLPNEDLLEVINHGFSDYIIPLSMTMDTLDLRFRQYNVDLEKSVGCFDEETCVGFVINAEDKGILYNTMTAVIPAYRGQHLFTKMLEYMDTHFDYDEAVLEVICDNIRAVQMYERNGFETFDNLTVLAFDQTYEHTDTSNHSDFGSIRPIQQSFGNTHAALSRIIGYTRMIDTDDAQCFIQDSGNIIHIKAKSTQAASRVIQEALKSFPSLKLSNLSKHEDALLQVFLNSGAEVINKQFLMRRKKPGI